MCFMGILKNLLIAGFVLGNVNAMNQDNVQQDNNAQSDVVIFNNQASILACDCCFGKMIKHVFTESMYNSVDLYLRNTFGDNYDIIIFGEDIVLNNIERITCILLKISNSVKNMFKNYNDLLNEIVIYSGEKGYSNDEEGLCKYDILGAIRWHYDDVLRLSSCVLPEVLKLEEELLKIGPNDNNAINGVQQFIPNFVEFKKRVNEVCDFIDNVKNDKADNALLKQKILKDCNFIINDSIYISEKYKEHKMSLIESVLIHDITDELIDKQYEIANSFGS